MNPIPFRATLLTIAALALIGGGIVIGYSLRPSAPQMQASSQTNAAGEPHAGQKPLYYRDPDGKPDYSATPKKTADGRDFKPVYGDAGASAGPPQVAPKPATAGRILYYKNPMGLPDTSPVPKKDAMGMDYIPVYANGSANGPGVVSVSPARVQMLGVKTAPVEMRRALARTIQATGTIAPVEGKVSAVTTKFDGVVEKLYVSTTGARVRAGEPLARVWIQTPETMMQAGPDVITREIDLVIALQDKNQAAIAQAENVLRQYGIPESAIQEIHRTGQATRFITITAPRSGVILEKPAIEGMHFNTGDPLFKIADLSTVWLMADVPEQDMGAVRAGETVTARLVAYPGRTFTGKVDFVYPTLQASTRAGQARIVLPNPEGLLRESMYANVAIEAPAPTATPIMVVPDSAILSNGSRQVVLVALGQGRFQPREVHTGLRGDGTTQILDGLKPGEQVVVGANFLIDAESSLQTALQSFSSGNPGAGPALATP